MLIFEICLPLKEPLVVDFTETRARTSRKYLFVQGMNLPKLPGKQKLFWLHSSTFVLELNSIKMLILGVFLPERELLVATFSETRAVTSRKDMVEQSINISKV